jgi:RHH-type transcriptional regulator, rel operon repressor / antitoxin RelB
MAKLTMTVRVDEALREDLDDIAQALDRDRSYVVNEALRTYVEMHEWQARHIEQGLRDADQGRFATAKEVERAFAHLRRSR